jgi:hypothetical protein
MDRPLPQPGRSYLHYKGKTAQIIGVATNTEYFVDFVKFAGFLMAQRSDGSPKQIRIRRDGCGDLRFYAGDNFGEGPLVIYSCSGDIWARPLGEFMEVLGNGTTRYFRFALLPDNYWDTPVEMGDQGSLADLMREV